MGGGMDLALGGKKLMVMMLHTTKEGGPRIVRQCTFPLTARNCVNKIFTDIAVIDVTKQGLVLREVAPAWTAEEVQALTEAKLIVGKDLKEIEL
jgi:3-oxoacid CoA-transferase B subunit